MIPHTLSTVTILLHLSLAGVVLSMPQMRAVVSSYARDRDAAPVIPPFARRWDTQLDVDSEKQEEEEEEEEKADSKGEIDSPVYGEQKRFFRPADEERREKFAELRERNSRDQERRRQQRQLRKSQKERKTRANPDHKGRSGTKQTDGSR
jgi:vacuolar-type H+-ATPase subunit I/STV1